MKSEIKQLWIEALKTGKYKQGIGYLKYRDNFCCLGVLVDCYLKQTAQSWERGLCGIHFFEKETGTLPSTEEFRSWAGEIAISQETKLTQLNDYDHANFEEIATWIEENL